MNFKKWDNHCLFKEYSSHITQVWLKTCQPDNEELILAASVS